MSKAAFPLCVHEASHAAVGVLRGGRLVEAVAFGDSGHVLCDNLNTWDRIVYLVAGEVGEARFAKRAPDYRLSRLGHDRSGASDCLLTMHGERQTFDGHPDIALAFDAAGRDLAENWPAVLKLAEKLERDGEFYDGCARVWLGVHDQAAPKVIVSDVREEKPIEAPRTVENLVAFYNLR